MAVNDTKTIKLAEDKINKVSKELSELTEKRKEERIAEETKEKEIAKVNKRKEEIQNDLDRIRDLEDVTKAERRIRNLSDETNTSDLESQVQGIKQSINEQIREDRRIQKEKNLESVDKRKAKNAKRWLKEHPEEE